MEFPAYLSLILTGFFCIPSEIDLGKRNVVISYVFLRYVSPSLLQGTSIRMNLKYCAHQGRVSAWFSSNFRTSPIPKSSLEYYSAGCEISSECPLAFFRFVPIPVIPHYELLEEYISFPCQSALNFSPGRSPVRARWSPKVKVPITFQCDCFFLTLFQIKGFSKLVRWINIQRYRVLHSSRRLLWDHHRVEMRWSLKLHSWAVRAIAH